MKKNSNIIILILSFITIVCVAMSAITLKEAQKNEKDYWDKQNKERMDNRLNEYQQKEKDNE